MQIAAESLLRHFRTAFQSSECLRGTHCMPRPNDSRSTDFFHPAQLPSLEKSVYVCNIMVYHMGEGSVAF